jgi:hypothetical protein
MKELINIIMHNTAYIVQESQKQLWAWSPILKEYINFAISFYPKEKEKEPKCIIGIDKAKRGGHTLYE